MTLWLTKDKNSSNDILLRTIQIKIYRDKEIIFGSAEEGIMSYDYAYHGELYAQETID